MKFAYFGKFNSTFNHQKKASLEVTIPWRENILTAQLRTNY